MRPLYYDELRPDMPNTFVMTTGGGVLHGDRQRMDLRFGPGTAAHVTTQAHTKISRLETGYATSLVNIDVDQGAYVEYLPDPVIPFDHSRYYQRTKVTLHSSAPSSSARRCTPAGYRGTSVTSTTHSRPISRSSVPTGRPQSSTASDWR